jgi:hypothetical protein
MMQVRIDNSPELWETRRPVQSAPQPKGSQMEQITISGKTFNVPLRYEEGHELSAGEAAALNQMLHENLRNNFATRVKKAIDNGGFDQVALQSEFDKYAEQYQFGSRARGGPRIADPILKEARAICRLKIDSSLKAKGMSIRDVTKKALATKMAELIQRPDILELARQRVAELQAIAAEDLAGFATAAE